MDLIILALSNSKILGRSYFLDNEFRIRFAIIVLSLKLIVECAVAQNGEYFFPQKFAWE